MFKARILFCLLFVLFSLQTAAQTNQAAQTKDKELKEKQEREEKLQRETKLLAQLLEDARGLRLPENRAFIYARVGGAYWNLDEKYARKLFQEAVNELLTAQAEAENEKNNRQSLQNLLYGQSPRNEIINYIAARDAELALEALLKTRPARIALEVADLYDDNQTPAQLYAKNEVQTEQRLIGLAAEQNADFAAKRFRDSLKKGVTYETLNLLKKIAQKNEKLADELTGEVVQRFLGMDYSKGYQTLEMIGYFAGELGREKSADEKGLKVSDELLRALLTRMTDFWLSSKNTQSYGYWQVKTLVEKIYPDRAEKIRLKMEKINAQNQTSGYNDYNKLMQSDLPPDELLGQIEKVPASSRNEFYRQVADKYAQGGNIAQAEKIINEKISDDVAADYLSRFYGNLSNRLIAQGKFQEARGMIGQIPLENQRISSLIYLATQIFQKDPGENQKWAIAVLDEARALLPEAPETQIELESLLNLAGAFAQIEPNEAFRILEGVRPAFNEIIQANYVLAKYRNSGGIRQGELLISASSSAGNYNLLLALRKLKSGDLERAIQYADGFSRLETRISLRLHLIDENFLNENFINLPISERTFTSY